MPVPDLPIELWLEILAYLPHTYLSRMMGVNRTLFELALDDKYEEVRFISDDKAMLDVFKQLEHDNIARRVRHLFIRPAFLPGIDEIQDTTTPVRTVRRSWMKTLFKKPPKPMLPSPTILDPSSTIMEAASKAVSNCPNLQELTIVVYDHALTPLFQSFLRNLWQSVGSGLRKLTINTTMVKLSHLLESILASSKSLDDLETIEVYTVYSRFSLSDSERNHSAEVLADFISCFKSTLTSLSLSSAVPFDHVPLFKKVGRIPKMRKFELWFFMSASTLSTHAALGEFLRENGGNIEHLVLKPRPRYEPVLLVDDTFRSWVLNDFAKVKLPNVKTLDLGLRDHRTLRERTSLRFLPILSSTIPNLINLILTHATLYYPNIVQILNCVPAGSLETLQFSVHFLSPELFDLLASRALHLAHLDVTYRILIERDTLADTPQWEIWVNFRRVMEARRYPHWPLRHLRLSAMYGGCTEGHPNAFIMKLVAMTVQHDVHMDKEYRCLCDSGAS